MSKTSLRLHQCYECGFEGGPHHMSAHYKGKPSHRPPQLVARHKLHGIPQSWRERKLSKPKRKKSRMLRTKKIDLKNLDIDIKPLAERRPAQSPPALVNFCWNCGCSTKGPFAS